jgi:hypothetical protein
MLKNNCLLLLLERLAALSVDLFLVRISCTNSMMFQHQKCCQECIYNRSGFEFIKCELEQSETNRIYQDDNEQPLHCWSSFFTGRMAFFALSFASVVFAMICAGLPLKSSFTVPTVTMLFSIAAFFEARSKSPPVFIKVTAPLIVVTVLATSASLLNVLHIGGWKRKGTRRLH